MTDLTLKSVLDEVSRQKKTRVQAPALEPTEEGWEKFKTIGDIVMKDPFNLPVTPLAVNAAIKMDGWVDDGPIPIDQKPMEWEQYIINQTAEIIRKHHDLSDDKINDGDVKYGEDKNLWSGVDSWRNFFKMGREVTAESNTRRYTEALNKYFDHDFKFNVDPKLWELAMKLVLEELGRDIVPHTDSWPRGMVPFENYHTNVGWRWFSRDDATIDGKSAADQSLIDAKKLDLTDFITIPAVIFGRDQRAGFEYETLGQLYKVTGFNESKPRVIWAVSRAVNLNGAKVVLNLIEYAKNNISLFLGYNSFEKILPVAQRMVRFAEQIGWKWYNRDWSSFDTTLSPEVLQSATEVIKAHIKTQTGKKIYQAISDAGVKQTYIDWKTKSIHYKFGALPSGIIDTNYKGGICNAICTTYCLLKFYPDFTNIVQKFRQQGLPWMLVMGDDCLSVFRDTDDLLEISKIAAEDLGMTAHPNKGEMGWFFLQHRLVDDHFESPIARVVSKCFWIEREKGLGPYGWTMATWMKLFNIMDNPEFDDVVRLIAEFDKMKLGTVDEDGKPLTASQFADRLTAESQEQNLSTAERLYDGDPNKVEIFSHGGAASSDWINKMHAKITHAIGSHAVN